MTDNELRGIILKKFYDLRKDNRYNRLTTEDLGEIELSEYNRIGGQLRDHSLLDWTQPISGNGSGRISAHGVDVIEGTSRPPISISLNDHSIAVHSSQNVQIGNANSLNANTTFEIHKVIEAIDKTGASEAEKQEAKSLLAKLTNNATFASIVTAIIGMGTSSAS